MSYLPRAAKAVVVQMLDRGEQLRARIGQFRTSPDPWERVGVAVELEV